MSKKQVFELRMASRNKDLGLIIGKFPEPIVPELLECSGMQNEINMYVKDEDIHEDDVLEVTSTNQHEIAEAKALEMKSKKRRKNYRLKSEIVLEQERPSTSGTGASKPINWVGNRVNTTVEDTAASSSTTSGPKYAILQIMTSGVGNKLEKHVNVLHVGDWFSFIRPSSARVDVTLEVVNDMFESQQRAQQESNKRYNKLLAGYRNSSRRGGGDEEGAEDAPLVFGKASASSRATARQLTEDGVDLDGAENNKWQDVDMHEGASDDEDDTGHVQAEDNDNEERAADINEAYMNSSGGESDDDEDQDEEDLAAAEKREKEEQAQASLQHLESGAAQLESALEFQQKVLVNITDKDKDRESNKRKLDRMGSSGENDSAGGGAVRSGAVAGTDKSGAKLRMVNHVSIANGEVQGSKASPVYSAASSSSSTSSALSEDNVRAYIKRHGGRVQSKVLMKEFKKSIKDSAANKELYRSILIKLTKKEEDSVLGTMLMLK